MSDNYFIALFDNIPTWVMLLPIFICSVISIGVIIERMFFFNKIKYDYKEFSFNVKKFFRQNDKQKFIDYCEGFKGPIINLLKDAVVNTSDVSEREDVIQRLLFDAQMQIEKRISVVATIATIAPMFGLLGTVTGMMKSFSGLAQAGSFAQDLLAYGISEALITTAFGLLVAIPSWIFYNYLVSKSEYYLRELEYIANVAYELPVIDN